MNSTNSFDEKFYTPRILEIGRIFFYIGLFFEILIFFLDRADWYNPYQSYMFRITFVIFLVKCLCTRYDRKQWLFIIAAALFSIITYKYSGKDEVVRCTVFIVAMKDMDIKRTLRFNYLLSVFGVALLGILAILGICGEVISVPGYGVKQDAFMLSMGLGSSNTWAIQLWLLIILAIYLYYDRLPDWIYPAVGGAGIVIFMLSRCRTELIMMLFTSFFCFIFSKSEKLRKSAASYVCGGIIFSACIGISVYAAKESKWWEFQTPLQRKIDTLLTGRMTCIYAFENGGGVLANWRPFGSPDFVEYFDMGWVRLFWWYGYIPGIILVLVIFGYIFYLYKKQDYMGLIFLVSMCVFTVYEAHFVSPFIARSYILFLFGGIWAKLICCKEVRKHSIAFYIGSLSKGGAERVFCNLASYFLSIGWEVTMITQYIREDEYPLPQGAVRVVSDIDEDKAARSGRIKNFLARIIKLHTIIRDTDADILMTTIGKANFMAIVCAAFCKTRVVVSVVADPIEEYPTKTMRLLLQTMFGDADGIIMQTTRAQKFLRFGLRKKSVILPNSVSEDFDKPRFSGEREKKIYMVGRMDSNKNQEMAIDAFASVKDKFPDFKLILIGDGELKTQLQEKAAILGLKDQIEFTGIIGNVSEVLHKGYAFVLTSNSEGMPNTLLEAMSLGLACISTDCPCGGPADIINDGEDGFLVPVGDVNMLAQVLDKLMSDSNLMNRVGMNSYSKMTMYKPAVVNEKWRDFYLNIISM